MRRMYTILHLYLMVAISLHLLWLMSKTTKCPTTSEFLQLFRTPARFFQSACFAILYQAFRDAHHSLCLAVASLIAFRLTIRMDKSSHFAKFMSSKSHQAHQLAAVTDGPFALERIDDGHHFSYV